MDKWSHDDYQYVLTEVARRSTIDPEFRALAMENATAAISKVSSKPMPGDLTFKFVDNSGSLVTVPLPDPVPGMEELSESELEAVAGGAAAASGDTVGGSWGR